MLMRSSRTAASTGVVCVQSAGAVSRAPRIFRRSLLTMPPKLTSSDPGGGGRRRELVDTDPQHGEYGNED
jgi:hypothetical protein